MEDWELVICDDKEAKSYPWSEKLEETVMNTENSELVMEILTYFIEHGMSVKDVEAIKFEEKKIKEST